MAWYTEPLRTAVSRAVAAIGLAAIATATACTPAHPTDPEAELRAIIAEAEQAAEARDPDPLQARIPDHYRDDEGRDAKTIRSLIGLRLLRYGNVHLLTRIDEIEVRAPGDASLRLFVGMAGVPIDSLDDLVSARASLYRFDLALRKPSGETDPDSWLVTHADFRPARLDDFR